MDASASAPVILRSAVPAADNVGEFAPSPTGHLLLAQGYPYAVQAIDNATLAASGTTYDTGAYVTAVAATPMRGGWIAAGHTFPNNVMLFRPGTGAVAPTSTIPTAGYKDAPRNGGLVFSPDGSTLYALTDPQRSRSFLQVIAVP